MEICKKSYNFTLGINTVTKETRGRKLLIEKYPDLTQDIEKIIEDNLSIDPHFRSEKQYVKLTAKEIKKRLIETDKYTENSFSNSYLSDLINKLGYGLKKVQKVKPLKKIEKTDDIFDNVHKKKDEAMKDENIALISLDTKDKVLIGPFSRKGLIEMSKKYNIEIELIYYPPYHSKYNPIERLWARLENIWNGFLLETIDICLNFMKNLTWNNEKSVTKLKVKKYEKGLTLKKEEMIELEHRHICRKDSIKKWSVIITP